MGGYLSRLLSRARTALLPRAGPSPGPRRRPAFRRLEAEPCPVVYLPPEPWLRSQPLPTLPPDGGYAVLFGAAGPDACLRPPGAPAGGAEGLDVALQAQVFAQQWQWKARCPRRGRNQVTLKIARLQHRPSASLGAPRPDPRAREARLQWALARRCHKCRQGGDGPLWFRSARASASAEPRPSAFRPLWRDGVLATFVPRPGPLRPGPPGAADPAAGRRRLAPRRATSPPRVLIRPLQERRPGTPPERPAP